MLQSHMIGHVAGCNGFQELQQLASVGLRAARLFAIDFGASLLAQLRELSIEGLPARRP